MLGCHGVEPRAELRALPEAAGEADWRVRVPTEQPASLRAPGGQVTHSLCRCILSCFGINSGLSPMAMKTVYMLTVCPLYVTICMHIN